MAPAFLYLDCGELVQGSMHRKSDEGNVRCRIVLRENLPEANASEPRRHAPSSLRCRVDLDPDDIHDHEWPQGWVRATGQSVAAQPHEKDGEWKGRTGGRG